jgi:signal transduction histidine kinase
MKQNKRILLIDDTPSIHEDFRRILCAQSAGADLDEAEAVLFGAAPPALAVFDLDSAYQGQEGVARVDAALAADRPYAMAFVDMRMPPGWDGLETVERLWQADPRLQVVICTAYSDHRWEEVLARLPLREQLLIVKKPFDMVEVLQLAHALTAKWTLARQAEERQRELEATVRQLRASETDLRYTMRELEAFAYSIAHDLRSPLARISSFSKLMAEQVAALGEKPVHYAARVQANADIGQEIVKGLLTLVDVARSRLDAACLDLSRLALQVIDELQAAAPARRVQARVDPGLFALADRHLLRVALTNLIENAWKFTSRREEAEIHVGLHEHGKDQSVFFVRDNGCGFAMADAGRLFEDFHRLHGPDEFPGTGVGLATVNRVLLRHGGRVWAESVPDEGSTFYFSLPRCGSEPCEPK